MNPARGGEGEGRQHPPPSPGQALRLSKKKITYNYYYLQLQGTRHAAAIVPLLAPHESINGPTGEGDGKEGGQKIHLLPLLHTRPKMRRRIRDGEDLTRGRDRSQPSLATTGKQLGSNQQVTLPVREIVMGRVAFVPFVTRRSSSKLPIFLPHSPPRSRTP